MRDVNIIVAVSKNMCIGKDNTLPWKQKTDMKFFRETTTENAVIMGRKTFESMGNRPLPNRLNIIVSKTLPNRIDGCLVARSIEDALQVCDEEFFDPYIIGGGTIYEQALGLADNIYMTVIDTEIEDGDTFFPDFDYREWEQTIIDSGEASEKDQYAFTIHKLSLK